MYKPILQATALALMFGFGASVAALFAGQLLKVEQSITNSENALSLSQEAKQTVASIEETEIVRIINETIVTERTEQLEQATEAIASITSNPAAVADVVEAQEALQEAQAQVQDLVALANVTPEDIENIANVVQSQNVDRELVEIVVREVIGEYIDDFQGGDTTEIMNRLNRIDDRLEETITTQAGIELYLENMVEDMNYLQNWLYMAEAALRQNHPDLPVLQV